MTQALYTINYPVRIQPDQYSEDISTCSLSVTHENGAHHVVVKLPDGLLFKYTKTVIVDLIQSVLATGTAATPNTANVYIALGEHLVNIEPWIRIGIRLSGDHQRSSCVLWATTEELRQLMVKLLGV